MAGTVASNGALPSLGKLATHGRPTSWTSLGRVQSSVSLDFTSASIDATLASLGFVFARASTATRINASGVMESVASGAMRIEHDPVTGAPLGYLCEETSTNHVRNSTMVGVVIGSPGTLPTNWSLATAGLTRTVVDVGVESGVPYVDVRLSGTATSALAQFLLDQDTAIAASASQAWTCSAYMRLVGGSLANVSSVAVGVTYRDAGGAGLASGATSYAVSGGALRTQRATHTATSPASTAYAQGIINISVVNGAAVDFTLRIGAPQLEQKPFATSFIPTAGAAVTRQLDALTLSDLSRIGFSTTAGSVVLRARVVRSALSPQQYAFGTGAAASNEMGVYWGVGARKQVAEALSGGVVQMSMAAGNVLGFDVPFQSALAWAANDAALVVDGGTPVTDVALTLPVGLDRMSIGGGQARGASARGVQIIRRVDYYPRRLPDAELQSLTA